MAEGGKVAAGFCLREEEKVHAAAWAKQVGTCWISGIDSLLAANEAGGSWCPFSCWLIFARDFGLAGVAPAASLSDYLISDQNQAETVQEKTNKQKTLQKDCCCCPGEAWGRGKKGILLKLLKMELAEQQSNRCSPQHPGRWRVSLGAQSPHRSSRKLPPLFLTHLKATAAISEDKADNQE